MFGSFWVYSLIPLDVSSALLNLEDYSKPNQFVSLFFHTFRLCLNQVLPRVVWCLKILKQLCSHLHTNYYITYNFDFVFMLSRRQWKGRSFCINMYSFFLHLLATSWKWFDELVSPTINRIFLLEKWVEFILGLLRVIFLHINWVLKNLWIVHRTPANQRSMISKGGKLIFLNISMNCLLDVEILAHPFYNL